MAERGKDKATSLFMLAMFAFIVILSLILVVFGSNIYRSIEQARTADNVSRAGTAYIASRVAASDSADSLSRRQGPEGDMLVLTEIVNGQRYETRLYLHDGGLLEEYAVAGAALDYANATPIVDTEVFSFSYADNVLAVTTSAGTQYVALRTPQGGEGL